MLQASPVVWTL